MERKEDNYFIVEKARKPIPKLRAVTFIGEEMVVVSNELVYQCNILNIFSQLEFEFWPFG